MTETDARNVLLVRVFETSPPGEVPWSDEDRLWASRTAAQVVGETAAGEAYVAQRASLALGRLSERDRAARRASRYSAWRPWAGWAVPLVALAAGLLGDAIGPSQRINVLAPPLLALIAWNLLAYVSIAARALARAFGRKPEPGRLGGMLVRGVRSVSARRRGSGSTVMARFAAEWARASAALSGVRAARVLHVAAIAFAIGALAGMYFRGLVLEYRAGWESTFLDAEALRTILGIVLGPASSLGGIALPDAARLEAMRFPGSDGEPAGPWIHLYAITVLLFVVVPRALLAAYDRFVERRLSNRFPLPLGDSYFAALLREHSGQAAAVSVVPFNHAPAPQAALALREMLQAALGTKAVVSFEAPTAYGDEESIAARIASASAPAIAVALFSASATPEPETHGAFVDQLAAALPPGARLLAMVDESRFAARFGGDDATSVRRRDERRLAWKRLLSARELQPLFVDLERGQVASSVHKLRDAIDRAHCAVAPADAR